MLRPFRRLRVPPQPGKAGLLALLVWVLLIYVLPMMWIGVAVAGAAAVLTFAVVAWRTPRPRTPRVKVPVCGRCGYCVRGIPALTCPECGSDLREVGILTPRMRWRPGWLLYAALWTAFLFMAAGPIRTALIRVLPVCRETEVARSIIAYLESGERFSLGMMATLKGRTWTWAWTTHKAPLRTLVLQPNFTPMNTGQLEADLPSGAYEFRHPDGQRTARPAGFGEAALVEWLTALGCALPDDFATAYAPHILAAIQEIPLEPKMQSNFGSEPGRPLPRVTAMGTSSLNMLPGRSLLFSGQGQWDRGLFLLIWAAGVLVARQLGRHSWNMPAGD